MALKPLGITDLRARKSAGAKIVMVTAYDATFARAIEAAGVDILLVGDSLGMVVQGHENTLRVTLDQMIYHTAAVCRGAQHTHVVGDLPFMSYHVSHEQAVCSAGRLVQEGGAHAVKLEGGGQMAATVERIVAAGIPVMGHIGLTPQRLHELGGFKVQGRDPAGARRLFDEARTLASAGCYSIVLEGIPADVAAAITAQIDIPTIGIGAGTACDGQVLVCYDLLGMNPHFVPKFVKVYDTLQARIVAATKSFCTEVRSGAFPTEDHTYRGHAGLRLVHDAASKNDTDDPERIYGVPV